MAKKENRHAELVSASANIEAPYELPDGWKWEQLEELSAIPITDGTHKTPTYSNAESGIPFISAKDVTKEYIDWSNIKYITKELHTELYKRIAPQVDDILLAKNGTTGVAAIVDIDKVFDLYVTLAVIRPNQEKILPRYLLRVINSPICKNQFDEHLTGIGVPNLHLRDIKVTQIPLPPTLAEQERIVNRIETMFAKLDQAQEKAQAVLDSFETRKAAILHKAFTGQLTANWRKENSVSDDSWEEKRLEDVCDFITKGTTPKKEDMSIGSGDIPYIKVYNLCFDTNLDFTIDPTFVKLESHKTFLARSITLSGDVLMNIVGPPFGKVSIVPDTYPEWNINQAIARFRCKPELYNVYLANYLISPKTIENMSRQIKTTAGQQNLTLEICRNITIPVPTFTEQQEIVRILATVLEKESRAKEAAQTVLDQIALLKKSILVRAFRGEL